MFIEYELLPMPHNMDKLSYSALKIHISEASQKLLEEAGGFVTEPRGETLIKVCISLADVPVN